MQLSRNIIIFFLLASTYLSVAYGNYRYFNKGTYESVTIVKVDNLKVNEMYRLKNKCQALTIAKGKPHKAESSSGPVYHNAGASYCWDVGAKNRILKDAKNNEYDFCVFEDGFMIDA